MVMILLMVVLLSWLNFIVKVSLMKVYDYSY